MDELSNIEKLLANGFHDATRRGLAIDYMARTATFDIEPDVSDHLVESTIVGRHAWLHLLDIDYVAVDTPTPGYPYAEAAGSMIDCSSAASDNALPPPRESERSPGRFFINDLNAFIHFEARRARLTWLE